MCDLHLVTDTLTLLVLGLLLGVTGLAGLLGSFVTIKPRWLLALAGSGVMAAGGAAAFAADGPRYLWLPLLLTSVLLFGGAVLRCEPAMAAFDRVWGLLWTPRYLAAVLLVGGTCLTAAQMYQLEKNDAAVDNSFAAGGFDLLAQIPELRPCPSATAFTDAGHPVPLWEPARASGNADFQQAEQAFLHQAYNLHLLQTMPPKSDCNCHGWVFTGGRCWVRGTAVETILHDNRYQVVSQPVPGDLAVFRDEQGQVMHTALVRLVRDDGVVLLESKWGILGCYLHTASMHAYGQFACTYHRTRRGGHLLRGNYPAKSLQGV
ncbi:MAG: hypothetical protein U0736_20605 [Gemmataceae bacterium]